MDKNISVRKIRKFFSSKSNIDVLRIYYCYQIGSTFVNLALMENTIIHAMAICDQIRVSKILKEDAAAWKKMIQKHTELQSSTLGNLITVLSRHAIGPPDLAYLRWVKEKRDFFIHRFFHSEPWPGDLDEDAIRVMCRRLLYLEHIFARAQQRIWKVFGRAGLMEYHDLGPDGALMMNVGVLAGEDEAWLRELAVGAVRRRAERQRQRRGT